MRFFLLLGILLFSVSAVAGEIVLLTSLRLNKLNVWHLEKRFRKVFRDSTHDIVIHHKADPKTLHKILTSPETEALIWVSHAAGGMELEPGFNTSDIVLDIWGNDVKKFFTSIPQNMKFLGLVGCQAKKILDGFRERGNYERYPNLEIVSDEEKVRLYPAFEKTLKVAADYLKAPRQLDSPAPGTMIDFQFTRSSYEDSHSLQEGWVEIGDRVLGFFELNGVSLESSLDQYVFEKISRKNIRFFRSKSATSIDESLGKLEIVTSSQQGTWKLFERDGKPIGGRDQQLYIFKKAQN